MQADWQALQPMHFDTSISLATGVSCRVGGGSDAVAERRTRSCTPRFTTKPSVGGFFEAALGFVAYGFSNISDLIPVLCRILRRRRCRLDVHEKRLELRRLGIGIADEGRQRIRSPAFPRSTGEAPMQRDAHDVNGLAVADQGPDPLGDNRFRFHRSAFRPDPHPTAERDVFLLGKLFRYF